MLPGGTVLSVWSAPLVTASLSFHGYSSPIGDPAKHEQTYDLEAAEIDGPWPPVGGEGTPHGDVLPLLTAFDDQLAILLPGERIDLRFTAPPPLEKGLTRTWFLTVSGWAKETSFHGRTGTTIGPLPYRGMTDYPPVGAGTTPR